MKSTLKNIIGAAFLFAAVLLLDLVTGFNTLDTKFLFILAILFLLCLILYLVLKNGSTAKTIAFNITMVFFVLIIFEKSIRIFSAQNTEFPYKVFEADLFEFHPKMGYVHKSNIKRNVFAKFNDSLVFTVNYNLDSSGVRTAPPFEPIPTSKSIVFFGCSFTFGYGLDDNQTFPYLVGDLNRHYKIYNFGTNAYGPHHMLKSLELNLIDSIVDVEPQYFIYTAIPTHVERAVRFFPTDYNGYDPKYVLNADGWPEYKGPFVQDSSSFQNKFFNGIRSSSIYSSIKSKPSNADIELFASIVAAAKKQAKNKYPNCEFHMFFWDDKSSEASYKVIKLLEEKHIKLHLISNILPPVQSHAIFPGYENHPNYLSNKYIANYIKERIIRPI